MAAEAPASVTTANKAMIEKERKAHDARVVKVKLHPDVVGNFRILVTREG
jgi:hypothetical protein